MAAAPGECLLDLKARPPDAGEGGLRAAAAWLARLHASPAGLGAPVDMAHETSRLAGCLAGAAGRRPELEADLVRLVETPADRTVAAGPPSMSSSTVATTPR